MPIQLRPYQQEASDAFFTALDKHQRQLILLPTGSGKTIVFGTIAEKFHGLNFGCKTKLDKHTQ